MLDGIVRLASPTAHCRKNLGKKNHLSTQECMKHLGMHKKVKVRKKILEVKKNFEKNFFF